MAKGLPLSTLQWNASTQHLCLFADIYMSVASNSGRPLKGPMDTSQAQASAVCATPGTLKWDTNSQIHPMTGLSCMKAYAVLDSNRALKFCLSFSIAGTALTFSPSACLKRSRSTCCHTSSRSLARFQTWLPMTPGSSSREPSSMASSSMA